MLAAPILNRRVPTDWKHVEKHPFRATRFAETPEHVELILPIPRQYREEYDQGAEGACVGYSQSWMMSIMNRKLYDARWLYLEAQKIDEWDDTPPGQGTSLRAAFDILRDRGHCRVYGGKSRPESKDEGIASNKWAVSADEVRAAIFNGTPVNFGVNWYRNFSNPEQKPRAEDFIAAPGEKRKRHDYWIGLPPYWGPIDGGHAITCVGASDLRQAFALLNTWGYSYPFIVWLPYRAYDRLQDEYGEAGIVVDR